MKEMTAVIRRMILKWFWFWVRKTILQILEVYCICYHLDMTCNSSYKTHMQLSSYQITKGITILGFLSMLITFEVFWTFMKYYMWQCLWDVQQVSIIKMLFINFTLLFYVTRKWRKDVWLQQRLWFIFHTNHCVMHLPNHQVQTSLNKSGYTTDE